MAAESGGGRKFDLPEEVVQVLPSDPFQQLDVARKITSIALSTRVNALESELSTLRSQIADKDHLIADLQSQVHSLDASLSQIADKLLLAEQDKETLLKENVSLSNTVKKLNRDVSKFWDCGHNSWIILWVNFGLTRALCKYLQLEVFRKTLMQSLQEDDDNSGGTADIVAKIRSQSSLTSTSQLGGTFNLYAVHLYNTAFLLILGVLFHISYPPPPAFAKRPSQLSSAALFSFPVLRNAHFIADNDASLPPSITSSTGNSFAEDLESDSIRPRVPQNLFLASQTSTPRITPPGSPPSLSASVSPTRTSKPASPRRHSISFSTSRGMYDDRSSVFSSISTTDPGTGSQTGRTRVDGKEFFRQVRNRLSYEQFGAFLANVKELNSHKQTKEETLRKADEIFGAENNDLYIIFEGLINRNVH
ncbi:hypothetical protein Fmac_013548 [Flemingia macrophylla]|uniref:At4g15545-like C-terminal domain-containing protein n=1 Tax=Flemingia macrophylla TaxID=520843 RepID=A0ABD1MTG2_9FABA